MADPASNSDLMRALGRLIRGLSALFWGLPVALVVCVHSARAEGFKSLGVAPAVASTALLAYGLWQLGEFQKQERVWRAALERARILSLINCGLSPFLYWSSRMPGNVFFSLMVVAMLVCGLLFLGSLNLALQRLNAMLPDEALRHETRQFTSLNLALLGVALVMAALVFAISRWPEAGRYAAYLSLVRPWVEQGSFWLLAFLIPLALVLLPVAMTMALLWKTKEVILDSVFGAKPPAN
jgi:hypothetical protein